MDGLLDERVRADRIGDAVLFVTLALVGIAGHVAAIDAATVDAAPLSPGMAVLAVVAPAVVWWRRARALSMLGALLLVAAVAETAAEGGLFSFQVGLVMMVLAHAVGAWSSRLALGGGVLAVLVILLIVGGTSDGNSLLAASALAVAVLAFPFAVGLASRQRQQYLAEVEQRLAAAERDRDERARRAIERERTRIARELHDVVAHHVSLIGVQAGAARSALGTSPEATRRALSSIEASSRDAVVEMRRLLDVLGPPGGTDEVEPPQPGLDRLEDLVASWRETGRDIDLQVDADPSAVPPAVSAATYRIVEESLTNVARHSAATSARVSVTLDRDAVVAEIADPGPAVPTADDAGGRGLVGMRERAAVFGGSVVSGPTESGGFAVHARVPTGS